MPIHVPIYEIPLGPITRRTKEFLDRFIAEVNRATNITSSPIIQQADYGSGYHFFAEEGEVPPLAPATFATTVPLPTSTATPDKITAVAVGPFPHPDPPPLVIPPIPPPLPPKVGDTVLVKNEPDATRNGQYVITSIGTPSRGAVDPGTPWELTRNPDPAYAPIPGGLAPIQYGTANSCTTYKQLPPPFPYVAGNPINVGTDPITYEALPQNRPVRVYDTVPVAGRYPAYRQVYDPIAKAWSDDTAKPVWAVGANGETLQAERYLADRAEYANGRMVWIAVNQIASGCCPTQSFSATSYGDNGGTGQVEIARIPVPEDSTWTFLVDQSAMDDLADNKQADLTYVVVHRTTCGAREDINAVGIETIVGGGIPNFTGGYTYTLDAGDMVITATGLTGTCGPLITWHACIKEQTCNTNPGVTLACCAGVQFSAGASVTVSVTGDCIPADQSFCLTWNGVDAWHGSKDGIDFCCDPDGNHVTGALSVRVECDGSSLKCTIGGCYQGTLSVPISCPGDFSDGPNTIVFTMPSVAGDCCGKGGGEAVTITVVLYAKVC